MKTPQCPGTRHSVLKPHSGKPHSVLRNPTVSWEAPQCPEKPHSLLNPHSVKPQKGLSICEATLLTRAIMAKMEESAMAVVLMPAWASLRACWWPPYRGAPSATTTYNINMLMLRAHVKGVLQHADAHRCSGQDTPVPVVPMQECTFATTSCEMNTCMLSPHVFFNMLMLSGCHARMSL